MSISVVVVSKVGWILIRSPGVRVTKRENTAYCTGILLCKTTQSNVEQFPGGTAEGIGWRGPLDQGAENLAEGCGQGQQAP